MIFVSLRYNFQWLVKKVVCFNDLNTPKFKFFIVIISIRVTYEKLYIKFSRPKNYRHFKKNFSEKLKISVYFDRAKKNLSTLQKKIFRKIENLIFLNYKHIKKSIWSKTGFAIFQHVFVYTDTKKTHIIIKSIHSSLCSEFKNEISWTSENQYRCIKIRLCSTYRSTIRLIFNVLINRSVRRFFCNMIISIILMYRQQYCTIIRNVYKNHCSL
ncbi:hypothetical protein AGLY_002022 [Aphis glycines]|uniref:Uncharacterized protein n=1 Tax=Aphis glycines TaxID=307491 RepID=A0A6G0U683_APHGL|nr:hypothetical protein AGLY_002022 [Aphis glycines]